MKASCMCVRCSVSFTAVSMNVCAYDTWVHTSKYRLINMDKDTKLLHNIA